MAQKEEIWQVLEDGCVVFNGITVMMRIMGTRVERRRDCYCQFLKKVTNLYSSDVACFKLDDLND